MNNSNENITDNNIINDIVIDTNEKEKAKTSEILYEYYKDKKDDIFFWGEDDNEFHLNDFSSLLLGVPILFSTNENENTVRLHVSMALYLPIEYELCMETSFNRNDSDSLLQNGDMNKSTLELIARKYRRIERETKDMSKITVFANDINDKYNIRTNNEPFTNILLYDDYLHDTLDDNYIFSLSVFPIDKCDLHTIDVYVRENHLTNTIEKEDIGSMVDMCRKVYSVLFPYVLDYREYA